MYYRNMDGDGWFSFSLVIKDLLYCSILDVQSDLKKPLSWDNIY